MFGKQSLTWFEKRRRFCTKMIELGKTRVVLLHMLGYFGFFFVVSIFNAYVVAPQPTWPNRHRLIPGLIFIGIVGAILGRLTWWESERFLRSIYGSSPLRRERAQT
jgi:hypothetical protein